MAILGKKKKKAPRCTNKWKQIKKGPSVGRWGGTCPLMVYGPQLSCLKQTNKQN